ncbi:MAG: M56 family metallopeptidase [Williamsia sp.]|nr:M56 family metallopeptidase [Williamsia sp.]
MTTYIIKLILCSALFMFVYKVFLEKEKGFRFNRFYLLSSLLLSLVIPVTSPYSYAPALPGAGRELIDTGVLYTVGRVQAPSAANHPGYPPLLSIVPIIYLTITAILSVRFLFNLSKILLTAAKNPVIHIEGGKIVLVAGDTMPHSFLQYIFLNKQAYESGEIKQEVLVHELSHVQQKHAADILLIEILQIFCWFNPCLYFYKKAIQLNHEFLADEQVINAFHDTAGYQYLLLEQAQKQATNFLTSPLNYSITKKRLIMLSKQTSLKRTLYRQLAVVPAFAASLLLFSLKTHSQDTVRAPKPNRPPVPSTQQGVSQEMLDEYKRISDKTIHEKDRRDLGKLSDEDRNRLQTLFLSMSKEQQGAQTIQFMRNGPPFSRIVPTEQQITSWKNGKVYGLWIDGKRTNNTQLNNHKNTDFAHVFISKLGKNTVNYGKHFYQVDLMTTEGYNTYLKQANENRKEYVMTTLWVPRKNK